MAALAISHDDIVAEYQRRLIAVTHENVMLGLALQQAQQQLAAHDESQPSVVPQPESAKG